VRLAQAGIDAPLLNAQLLMARVLECSRLDVIAHPERFLTEAEQAEYGVLVEKRASRYPLAYILGRKEFYGVELEIRPGVLIPRPETEILVEECLKRLEADEEKGNIKRRIVADIGVGSGAIAVAIAINLNNAEVYATETSPTAMEVARINIEKHKLSQKVRLLEGDLCKPLRQMGMVFDAIISNPPYIPTGEIENLQPEVKLYEPREALDGGADGLDVYRNLIPDARELLKEGAFLAVEIGIGQAEAVTMISKSAGYRRWEVVPDLANIERVVIAYR
jgi:release factor glutamine methyltransferase